MKNRKHITFDEGKFQDAISRYQPQYGIDLQQYLERVNNDLYDINLDINVQIEWGKDIFIYGKKDYWATPAQTLSTQAGDCEDFALLKWFLFLLAGVPLHRMRLVYCTYQGRGHMVLAVYSFGLRNDPYIYDNTTNKVSLASERTDLMVVMMFDLANIYTNNKQHSLDSSTFSLWENYIVRLAEEGLTFKN